MFLLASCNSPISPKIDPVPIPEPVAKVKSATVTITNIYQDYYSSLGDYGYTKFFYEVKNTGNCFIDYYKIWFEATCTDGSKYIDWDNGLNVDIDGTIADYTLIYTSWKQYSSIRVVLIELTSY
jgi:hypothetical protein